MIFYEKPAFREPSGRGINSAEVEDEVNRLYDQLDFSQITTIQIYMPGKEFFTNLYNIVQERYKIDFSMNSCLNSLTADDISKELKEFFAQL